MMMTNFFLTMVKSWMETYFTKLGEEYDIVLWSHLNDRIQEKIRSLNFG
jgi:hypothetical protein